MDEIRIGDAVFYDNRPALVTGLTIEDGDQVITIDRDGEIIRTIEDFDCRFSRMQLPDIDGPAVGTYAHTARMMAHIMPMDDDPDFWDRWKDEMKEQDWDK